MQSTQVEAVLFAAGDPESSPRQANIPLLPPEFVLLDSLDDDRESAERFVARRFHDAYGAELSDYLPLLLSMHCGRRRSGVIGVSLAARGPLFLEQYLDVPVEAVLEHATGLPVARHTVVEIGNLVVVGRGSSLALFIALAGACDVAGYETLVFTATSTLRHRFERMGFSLTELAAADMQRLPPASRGRWGDYYDHDPRVFAGRVDQAMALIGRRRLFVCLRGLLARQIIELGGDLRHREARP